MRRLPSLRLLIGFESAARLGSYSRAADELCLTQSAISHQITQLEKQLGQSLFRRIGRGVELTMAGKSLQQTVSQSMAVMSDGLRRIDTYLNPGLVVIVCPASIAQGWLLPNLQRLQTQFPTLCPLIATDESARYVDEIDVDISISYRPLQQKNIVDQQFLSHRIGCVAGAELADNLQQQALSTHVCQANYICLEQEAVYPFNSETFSVFFSNWAQGALFDDIRLLIESVRRNQGVAFLPLLAVDDAIRRKQIKVLADYPSVDLEPLWISRKSGVSRSMLIEQVYNALIKLADEHDSLAQD